MNARSHTRPSAKLLQCLAAQIRAVEGRFDAAAQTHGWLRTGWATVDQALQPDPQAIRPTAGGLPRQAIHEWFGLDDVGHWTPPVCVLVHLAWQALASHQTKHVVWVGRRVWPHPQLLLRQGDQGLKLLRRSVFIDLDSEQSALRLWAIDLALRNPDVTIVIADGCKLDMAATRRLLLAAESGHSLGLLARPPTELPQRSAGTTRWHVRREPSPKSCPRWTIKLLRAKGRWSALGRSSDTSNPRATGRAWPGPRLVTTAEPSFTSRDVQFHWMVEWDHATGAVIIPADVVGGSGQTQKSALLARPSAKVQTA